MPCCGKKRSQASQTAQSHRVLESAKRASLQRLPEPGSQAWFQYRGKTGLTVLGPRTGTSYRFDGPGAVVAVDRRDWRALTAVSILRQVGGPEEGGLLD
jgi:hypothetical protein